ncbi:unnamed protein product [Clonostachys rhizophaga]|uniref:Peptidase M20 domain-containing protein 2 n=1 Tax=Clonostachys rhizophaga TaxID=160324 RepID=A0A9N9YE63_9HYPO|nr:unnamed protein product [Clonostachys rhizophaga]
MDSTHTGSSVADTAGTIHFETARSTVSWTIEKSFNELEKINLSLHQRPETAYQEFFAHETITKFLQSRGFDVHCSAYGLETCFEVEVGHGGRLVIFCAEYDALPDIGHACGHNLIATSSLAAFLGAVEALKQARRPGRIRLLGTPAEEGGGGKVKLIDAGAFPEEAAAAIMAHPVAYHQIMHGPGVYAGVASLRFIASQKFRTEFHGRPAHAGCEPWKGINALDAAVASYNCISMLRQQMAMDERVHAIIEVGGTVQSVIPDYTRMSWNVRGPTIQRTEKLVEKVKACIEGAATASGCKLNYITVPMYANLRANGTLCRNFVNDMENIGEKWLMDEEKPMTGSSDMGNVSHVIPSFHCGFAIPSEVGLHNPGFTAASGTAEAHEAALKCAKGMATLAIRVLFSDDVAEGARLDFQRNDD